MLLFLLQMLHISQVFEMSEQHSHDAAAAAGALRQHLQTGNTNANTVSATTAAHQALFGDRVTDRGLEVPQPVSRHDTCSERERGRE